MPTPWQRDHERDRERLTRWLAGRLPGASRLEVRELRAPEASGFSNDTLLCELSLHEGGVARGERLVVRIQPTGFQVFPEYDLPLQFRGVFELQPGRLLAEPGERRRHVRVLRPAGPPADLGGVYASGTDTPPGRSPASTPRPTPTTRMMSEA